MLRVLLGSMLVTGLAAAVAQPADPVTPPPTVPSPPAVAVPPTPATEVATTFATADDLLTALESADAHLRTLEASIQLTSVLAVQADTQTRRGTLYLDAPPAADPALPPRRRFAVNFTETVYGQRLKRTEHAYIFDGEWFVQKLPAEKQFIARQVVPPGEVFDPLKIGEGPFPVPIGQRREAILARFQATLPPLTETLETDPGLVRFVEAQGMVQLRLVPRAGTVESEEFVDVRIWYRRLTDADGHPILLPQIARTEILRGDITLVVLLKPNVNAALPDHVFDMTPPEGWATQFEAWRQPTR